MRTVIAAFLLFCSSFNTVYTQTTVILQPGPDDGCDTYINSAFPDYQWGTNPNLVPNAWTYDGTFGIGRALIKFDLSLIPPDAQVLDARLTLYYDPAAAYGLQYGDNASCMRRITEAWDEMVTTWATEPGSTSAGQVVIPATTSQTQDLTDINMTGLVADWVLHPATNFGFMHRMVTEETYRCLVYSSSDHANPLKRPKLIVTYRLCDRPVAGFSCLTQIPKVTFTDTSSSATSWLWNFGDGFLSTLQNPVHLYESPGIYNVCLKVADSCGSDSICRPIHVCEMPAPHFGYSSGDLLVSFSDSSTQPQTWFWSFGDGFYSDLQHPVHLYSAIGSYLVCETVTNSCGQEVYCDTVRVVISGINTHSMALNPLVFPQPASDWFGLSLSFPVGTRTMVTLMAMNGQVLQVWDFDQHALFATKKYDISRFSKAVYLLQIKNSHTCITTKLVIQ